MIIAKIFNNTQTTRATMKLLKLLSFTLFISIYSLTSFALQAKEYQVELLVFEHIYASPSPEGAAHVEFDDSEYFRLVDFSSVDSDNLQLKDEAQRIRGSRNFRLLKHIAWIQEGLSKEEAGSINISRWIPSLQGTVALYLNRYLHLDFHIEKTISDNNITLLDEKRRLRSKTTHYIDNPYFGIIARITSVEDIEKLLVNAVQE